jgi:hypothetical protein
MKYSETTSANNFVHTLKYSKMPLIENGIYVRVDKIRIGGLFYLNQWQRSFWIRVCFVLLELTTATSLIIQPMSSD